MGYRKVIQYSTKVTWSEIERFQEMKTETERKIENYEKWKLWKLRMEMEMEKELKRDRKISEMEKRRLFVDHLKII